MTTLRERLAQMGRNIGDEPGVQMTGPVAAALVAVAVQAERGQRHYSTECGTDPDQGIFHAVMASRRDDMKAALAALAAALGVSR